MSTPAPAAAQRIVLLLTAISSIGQYGSSVYLPSFPAIASALAADPATVQLTLAAFLGVFATGQLVVGPLSDRFGRRPLMAWGFVFFVAGSVCAALAPSIGFVFLGRVLQAIGAAATTVAARAAVRDLFSGTEMARAMGLMAMVFGVVPAAAPLIGGVLQDAFGWTAPMWSAALLGLLIGVLGLRSFQETNRNRLPSLDLVGAILAYRPMISSRSFMAYALVSAFGMGALFSFLGGSPGAFIGHMGVSATGYGFYPPFGVAAFVIGAGVARRLAGRMPPAQLIRRAMVVQVAGAFAMAALPAVGLFQPIPVILCMVVFGLGFGPIVPTSLAAAVGRFPERAGTAAALIGAVQILGSTSGAAVTGLLTPMLQHMAFPFAMAGMVTAGAVTFLVMMRSERG